MAEIFEKLAILLVGWLLGLLAPVIVDAIKRTRENKRGREAIQSELAAVGTTFALASYSIDLRQAIPIRPRIEKLISHLQALNAGADDETIKNQRQLLGFSDQELDRHYERRRATQGAALTLQKYRTPMLDARVPALWSFDAASQRSLLEIKSALDILHETVDRATYFNNLTFQKLDSENHARAVTNVEDCYKQYSAQAERLVGLIRTFVASKSARKAAPAP